MQTTWMSASVVYAVETACSVDPLSVSRSRQICPPHPSYVTEQTSALPRLGESSRSSTTEAKRRPVTTQKKRQREHPEPAPGSGLTDVEMKTQRKGGQRPCAESHVAPGAPMPAQLPWPLLLRLAAFLLRRFGPWPTRDGGERAGGGGWEGRQLQGGEGGLRLCPAARTHLPALGLSLLCPAPSFRRRHRPGRMEGGRGGAESEGGRVGGPGDPPPLWHGPCSGRVGNWACGAGHVTPTSWPGRSIPPKSCAERARSEARVWPAGQARRAGPRKARGRRRRSFPVDLSPYRSPVDVGRAREGGSCSPRALSQVEHPRRQTAIERLPQVL